MPEQKCLQWPVNLVEDIKYHNKSIYVSDYCSRNRRNPERRRVKTKETPRYAKDIFNPTSRFLNDHFQTSSHIDLKNHCERVLKSIDKRSDGDYIYHGKGKGGPLYSGLPSTPVVLDDSEPMVNVLPASLKRIEAAWKEEANTTKRERGYIYGKAGAKKWYHQRKNSAAKETSGNQMIPGMTKWLNEANEFEKQVVHNFMNNVSDALKEERPSSSEIRNVSLNQQQQQHYSDNPKIEDYMDNYIDSYDNQEIGRPETPQNLPYDDEYFLLDEPYGQNSLLQNEDKYKNVSFKQPDLEDLISPRSQGLLRGNEYVMNHVTVNDSPHDSYDIPPSPTAVQTQHKGNRPRSCQPLHRPTTPSNYPRIPRAQSAMGRYISDVIPTAREKAYSVTLQSEADQPQRNLRIQSAKVRHPMEAQKYPSRAMSADSSRKGTGYKYSHRHNHNGQSCTSCQNREIKEIAAQLAAMKPISGKKTEKRPQLKMAGAGMYKTPMKEYAYTEDYVDNGAVFGNVSKRGNGHFIIHPEFVSERAAPKKSYR